METAMLQKVYLTSNNKAAFICPQCGNATLADVSKYAHLNQRITINCRCKCKHQFKVTLEKRHYYRKKTNLPGKFSYRQPNGELDIGLMRVVNISFSGAKLQLDVARSFREGESLKISFHLDDKQNTFYEREVIVFHINHNLVGVAFVQDREEDPYLGYYLKK